MKIAHHLLFSWSWKLVVFLKISTPIPIRSHTQTKSTFLYLKGGWRNWGDSSQIIGNCTETDVLADKGGGLFNTNSHPTIFGGFSKVQCHLMDGSYGLINTSIVELYHIMARHPYLIQW